MKEALLGMERQFPAQVLGFAVVLAVPQRRGTAGLLWSSLCW